MASVAQTSGSLPIINFGKCCFGVNSLLQPVAKSVHHRNQGNRRYNRSSGRQFPLQIRGVPMEFNSNQRSNFAPAVSKRYALNWRCRTKSRKKITTSLYLQSEGMVDRCFNRMLDNYARIIMDNNETD